MAAGLIIDHNAIRKAELDYAESLTNPAKEKELRAVERKHAEKVAIENKTAHHADKTKLPRLVKPAKSKRILKPVAKSASVPVKPAKRAAWQTYNKKK